MSDQIFRHTDGWGCRDPQREAYNLFRTRDGWCKSVLLNYVDGLRGEMSRGDISYRFLEAGPYKVVGEVTEWRYNREMTLEPFHCKKISYQKGLKITDEAWGRRDVDPTPRYHAHAFPWTRVEIHWTSEKPNDPDWSYGQTTVFLAGEQIFQSQPHTYGIGGYEDEYDLLKTVFAAIRALPLDQAFFDAHLVEQRQRIADAEKPWPAWIYNPIEDHWDGSDHITTDCAKACIQIFEANRRRRSKAWKDVPKPTKRQVAFLGRVMELHQWFRHHELGTSMTEVDMTTDVYKVTWTTQIYGVHDHLPRSKEYTVTLTEDTVVTVDGVAVTTWEDRIATWGGGSYPPANAKEAEVALLTAIHPNDSGLLLSSAA